ncbi:MAG: hypothetical protein K1X56_09425 [Flavobacteriales bacterium]|nr:hypothetical protein [Flavobacteriales bacterium]
MKLNNHFLKGASKVAATLILGASLMTSCSKGTSCPAYTGYKKYHKNASFTVVETAIDLKNN